MKIDSPTFLTETTFISASVQFSSGSQKFGNTSDDTHKFIGKISSSGDLSATGNLDIDGASPTYCLNFNYKPSINSFNLSQNIEITPNINSNFNPVDNKLCITGFNYATDYKIKINKGFEGYESKLSTKTI